MQVLAEFIDSEALPIQFYDIAFVHFDARLHDQFMRDSRAQGAVDHLSGRIKVIAKPQLTKSCCHTHSPALAGLCSMVQMCEQRVHVRAARRNIVWRCIHWRFRPRCCLELACQLAQGGRC